MNSYTIELRVELPENAAQYMTRRVQRDGAIDLDERDWLANLVQGSVLATLVTRVERFPVPHRGDVTVHAYRATRDRIAEDPEAESYGTPALSPAGQAKVQRMFARGAAESEAQEAV